jgi:hypothetical protein
MTRRSRKCRPASAGATGTTPPTRLTIGRPGGARICGVRPAPERRWCRHGRPKPPSCTTARRHDGTTEPISFNFWNVYGNAEYTRADIRAVTQAMLLVMVERQGVALYSKVPTQHCREVARVAASGNQSMVGSSSTMPR